jgi:hypothetical protein
MSVLKYSKVPCAHPPYTSKLILRIKYKNEIGSVDLQINLY